MSGGLFITFEGGDGAGKSAQISLLSDHLTGQGRSVVPLREPGGTKAGDMIRSILLSGDTGDIDPVTELLLFSAARREIVSTIIAPALEEGKIVLCDRFYDSTMAYQGFGRKVDLKLIETVTKTVCDDITPDRTIFLDLPVEEGLNRAEARLSEDGTGEGRFENERLEFHQRVRQGFLAIAKEEPERIKTVDATGSIEEVFDRVKGALEDIL